jgi:hypothetical protein
MVLLAHGLRVRFVDRDMFMRYTHFGVGHPVMLRRMTRECLGSDLVALDDAMDVINDDAADHDNGDGDGEFEEGDGECEEDDGEQEEAEDEIEDLDEGDDDDEDEEDDTTFDDLSF